MRMVLSAFLLAAVFLLAISPAEGRVVLVLHPEGYVYSPDGAAPTIEAPTGATFTLWLSIATDTAISLAGLNNAEISFSGEQVQATQEDSPVDETDQDAVFTWNGLDQTNTADNAAGTLSYGRSVNIGEAITLSAGQYKLGSIEWSSLSSSRYVIAVDNDSVLMPENLGGENGENLLDGWQGCTVNPDAEADGSNSDDTLPAANGAVTTSCFIATAAFGSEEARELVHLRRFRDRCLLQTCWGRKFVAAYYRLSPSVAEKIRGRDGLRQLVRIALKPLVWTSKVFFP